MANESIRSEAAKNGVHLWELAARLGITDATLSRKLRFEFSDPDRKKALEIIEEIAAEPDRK